MRVLPPLPVVLALLLAQLCGLFLVAPVQAALSVLSTDPTEATARAAEIAAMAAQIANVPRNSTVGTTVVPLYYGPDPAPGSLTERIRFVEAQKLLAYNNQLPAFIAGLAVAEVSKLTTAAGYAEFYAKLAAMDVPARTRVPRPMAADNSDATFGRQRLTVKPMTLRQVRSGEYTDRAFVLTDAELAGICGRQARWRTIRPQRALYVQDYGDAARWNEPNPQLPKYVASVQGFFCFNPEKQQLLPIEIRFPASGLAYTPLDAATGEWALAKMALEAADASYHQMHHMATTHAVTVPIRVELYRNMAATHPVRALLVHHTDLDFGLEIFLKTFLLSPMTGLDITWGWGALGTHRFLHHQIHAVVGNSSVSANPRSFECDVAERGIDDLPTNRYVQYGRRLNTAIEGFCRRYVGVYYANDAAVRADKELQNWARATSAIPHVVAFPRQFTTRTQLVNVLRDLVYQSAVKHHAMNGRVTWQSMVPPFATGALWRPLPTRKLQSGETLEPLAYGIPPTLAYVAMGLPISFFRPANVDETLSRAYRAEPFRSEPRLAPAIAAFEAELAQIDTFIQDQEKTETYPYDMLRPSQLPFYVWI